MKKSNQAKENQTKKEQQHNPHEKVFDDANRLLEKLGDMDYLDEIPDNKKSKPPKIPFPYGSNTITPYNFN